MPGDKTESHRQSMRLSGFDYARPGAYFITIVTQGRLCLFGEIINGEMQLNEAGEIVKQEWQRLGRHFPGIQLDKFVVMPNHFHGILIIQSSHVRATHPTQSQDSSSVSLGQSRDSNAIDGSPLQQQTPSLPYRPKGPSPGSLGAIIGQFKSRVTKRLLKLPEYTNKKIWQRGYYDHIIRNDEEHNLIHLYIQSNPLNWTTDTENPDVQPAN